MKRSVLVQMLQEQFAKISAPTLELFADELINQDIFPFYISDADAHARFDTLIKEARPMYLGNATMPKIMYQQPILIDGLRFEHLVLTILYYERAYHHYASLTTITGRETTHFVGCHLARLYIEQKRYAEAETFYANAIDHYKTYLDENDRKIIVAMQDLGYVYRLQGRFVEAEELWLKTLHLCREHPYLHESYVQVNLEYLSDLYLLQERHSYAEWLWREVINAEIKTKGEDWLTESKATLPLLEVYQRSLQREKSEALFGWILIVWRRKFGSLQPDSWHRAETLGRLHAATGRLTEAQTYLQQALMLAKPILRSDSHPAIRAIQSELKRIAALIQPKSTPKKKPPIRCNTLIKK